MDFSSHIPEPHIHTIDSVAPWASWWGTKVYSGAGAELCLSISFRLIPASLSSASRDLAG